ncbi:hypothetical protein AGABI1DRAFT_76890 [Agaricus bisporus var. burnettii JB137-S8]|uniref:Uncharacterized protein n=1 Tax=Agaricus bisporus var. burnettii (strain JB137-S8 / ATCC MYA-4627 / FGSC 10392) TaxID=597362 RepID=K5VTR6_AGABU|nr:uncharacterized protein AGABI1DRAFT_76890 [Agaricus bisporus var. burnettii JB137-S8]EKM77859.1 hypothetical protein AGABI1DRAFT_76890 [Agaricus bisporus var. burnettii JB137-S8]
MFSYLAYLTNRSFVFEDYTWSHLPSPYTIYDFALRPTRIPLNAYISGPTAGGSMDNAPESPPRAVSFDFWQTVCPSSDRHVIDSVNAPRDLAGPDRIRWWKEKIKSYHDVTCLEVATSQNEIFDFEFFGSQQILDVWPSLSQSPILTRFKWSPLVLSAIERNFALLPNIPEVGESALPQHQSLDTSQQASSTVSSPLARSTYPALLAVHIRRGDFKRHCSNLAEWGPGFHGFNSFQGLPDHWTSYSGSSMKREYYRKRCLPNQEEIVERLHNVRQDHDEFLSNQTDASISGSGSPSSGHKLRRVFVLTNAWPVWQDGLKKKLMADGWEDVVVSEDLTLDKEQKGVNVAVDMSIAERAEVFVGNGVSLPVRSLTRLMSHCCRFPPLVFKSFRGNHHATIVQRFTISSE